MPRWNCLSVSHLRECLGYACRTVAETGEPLLVRRYRKPVVVMVRLADWQRLVALENAVGREVGDDGDDGRSRTHGSSRLDWPADEEVGAVSAHVATVLAESASGTKSAVASPTGERGAKRKKKAAGRRGDSADRSRCRGGDSRREPSSQTGGDL